MEQDNAQDTGGHTCAGYAAFGHARQGRYAAWQVHFRHSAAGAFLRGGE